MAQLSPRSYTAPVVRHILQRTQGCNMVSTQERFIIVPNELTDKRKMVILSAWEFWNDHETELQDWCKDNHSDFIGMTVTLPDSKTLTAFCLRWQ